MAQQATMKKAATEPKTAPVKAAKKRGEPAHTFDYSKFRQSVRTEEGFLAYLSGYPDKTGLLGYLYRLMPAIDLHLVGKSESYITKIDNVSKMNSEQVAREFGRGEYMFKLTDSNRPKGQQEVCKTWFIIDDPDLLPIYDVRSLKLGDPKNTDEVARLFQAGFLVRDSNGIPKLKTESDTPQPSVSTGGGSGNDLFSRETMSQVLLRMIDKGAQSGADQLKQTIEVARILQPAQPAFTVEQIVEQVATRLERTTLSRNGNGDFFENFERWDMFIGKVRGTAPAAAAVEGVPGWVSGVKGIVGELVGAVPMVLAGLQQLEQMRSQHRRPARRLPNGQQQIAPLQDRIQQIVQLAFEKMQQGMNGYDYAAWMYGFYPGGQEVFDILRSQELPALMGFLAMQPAAAPFVNNPEKRALTEQFIADLLAYEPESQGAPAAADSASHAATA